ncbi:uncharacterized protein LOC100572963 [Acyrthosiphon pisum]|uniref:Uncharacterized protein n=1 Tax=Acyrthosiphon pisum TaxID=7029 RepID=A0A8R2ADX3_ACYPI|nr:uncharacterized protein LOC100572963 [Acyrthosiphon pisum]|eukprot:XP_003244279.1 PREDICTED: uncharacterized protein LOC100572963 [Acyrthosiphon pisum]
MRPFFMLIHIFFIVTIVMSIKNFFELSLLNKNKLTCMIEADKMDLLENMKKFEEMLKDTSQIDNFLLEKQINTCFELQCKIEDYSEKLQELEDDYSDSPNTLIDFISNIPNVVNDLGPESLVVVTSEKVGMQYVQLLHDSVMKNVIITTIRALTAGEVDVTLGNVKTALLDGSEAEYRKFVGSEAVRLVIADHVPAERLFRVWGDVHRDQCFATIKMNPIDGDGNDAENKNIL